MKAGEALSPTESTEQVAQRVFAELYEAIIAQETSVQQGEVEAIHDMRVAIRRLRAALGNFAVCLTNEERKQIRFWLKRLADALGAVRDLDVLMESFKLSQTSLAVTDRPAIAALLARLRRQRKRRMRMLLDFMAGETYLSFKAGAPALLKFQTNG
jgi:CHAD domain-containing protein